MSNDNTDHIIIVAPNQPNNPTGTDGLIPKPVVDGGVAVAVVFALTYFSTRLLRSVMEVMKVNKQGK